MMKYAYEICRWHHERYDGKGYPDGLKGEEIPISAQVVSLADVYDALVSDRVYKKAYSHEKAIEMILNGECGMFNPLLLECLVEIQDKVRKELGIKGVNECLEWLVIFTPCFENNKWSLQRSIHEMQKYFVKNFPEYLDRE